MARSEYLQSLIVRAGGGATETADKLCAEAYSRHDGVLQSHDPALLERVRNGDFDTDMMALFDHSANVGSGRSTLGRWAQIPSSGIQHRTAED